MFGNLAFDGMPGMLSADPAADDNDTALRWTDRRVSPMRTSFSTLAENEGLILHTTVGIGYETPWRQVEAMLIEAANRTPGLLKDPVPFVRQRSLGDFAVTYEVNAYTRTPDKMVLLYSQLHANILDVFNEHSVQIMTPAYEGDPEKPKVVARADWHLPPAAPASSPAPGAPQA